MQHIIKKCTLGLSLIIWLQLLNERYTVRAVVSNKRLDLFVQTSFIGVKKEALPRRQVYKPLSTRPKRTAVQLPLIVYHK